MNHHSRAGGFAAYSEVLPQSAAVAFVLAEVAVNSAVMERDPVVFAQVGAYLFGTELAADKGVDVFGNHGLCGLPEEDAHEKSPKCLGGNLGDFGGFCKGLLL